MKPRVRLTETREIFDVLACEWRVYVPYIGRSGELQGILIGIRRNW